MALLIQVVEFESSRGDDLRALVDQLDSRTGNGLGPIGGFVAEDRDNSGHHATVLEFEP